MIAPPLSSPVWVDSDIALERMVSELQKYAMLGVDTESNSLHAYHERVCLIQFSTPTTDYLLDPFQFDNLDLLAPLFANPSIEKIFHAAEYDVICLKRDYGFTFTNLFDTMLAARILGMQAVGLASILEAEFGISVDKKYQRANWGKRPIPQALREYARMDTHYLISLRNKLQAGLVASGLQDLAQEDFARMARVIPSEERNEDNWRISGCQHLDAVQRAVLHDLWYYRDRFAKKLDLPLFKVFSNQVLLDISTQLPRSRQELQQIKGITNRVADRHAEGLLHAVEAGLHSAPIARKNHCCTKPSDAYLQRIDMLRKWRRKLGLQLKVESDVILPRDSLEKIAAANPTTMDELTSLMEDVPWRLQQFGVQILENLEKGK